MTKDVEGKNISAYVKVDKETDISQQKKSIKQDFESILNEDDDEDDEQLCPIED